MTWLADVKARLHPERVYRDGLWSNPPGTLIDRLYREAKKANPRAHGNEILSAQHQAWLRRVHVDFHQRLRAEGIYVEGGP